MPVTRFLPSRQTADALLRLSRADKPIGSYLLLAPTLWSAYLGAAAHALPLASTVPTAAALSVGAFAMRSAACVVNDALDRRVDARVARTALRPLASGEVTLEQAGLLLLGHLSLAGGVFLTLDPTSQLLSLASLPLVAAYPLAKRWTDYPQMVLAATINWGALVGYSAMTGGDVALEVVLPLYLASGCWAFSYDTVYAHQDKADDVHAGVRSSALALGDRTRVVLTGVVGVAYAALLHAGMVVEAMDSSRFDMDIFFIGSTLGASGMLWQVLAVDLDNGESCSRAFVQGGKFVSLAVGLGIVGALVVGEKKEKKKLQQGVLQRETMAE